MRKRSSSAKDVVAQVSAYIAASGQAELPGDVVMKAKHHILDTLAAVVSGSELQAGRLADKFVRQQAGRREAQVAGSRIRTSAINAALANGMMAHADETDDSHEGSFTHPGCAVVPAALAVAEREGAAGSTFLRGVVAGYDIGCRITTALGVANIRRRYRSTHSMGGTFGAAAAAASVLGLAGGAVRYVLSYASQQSSGITYVVRDAEHLEKAFVFAGMPARNGVSAALLVQAGFTGVAQPFSGDRNFFETVDPPGNPERLLEGLGSRYEIMFTNIKKFSVGSPIQAPLEALLLLLNRHRLKKDDVRRIVVRLPAIGLKTVDNRHMPDINLQYILATALLDGDLSFAAAHAYERMQDPAVLEIKKRITLAEDPELSAAQNTRQGIIELTTTDGATMREHVVNVRGTARNPMTTAEVEKKCSELLRPVLGAERARRLIDRIWNLEKVKNVRQLRRLLSVSGPA